MLGGISFFANEDIPTRVVIPMNVGAPRKYVDAGATPQQVYPVPRFQLLVSSIGDPSRNFFVLGFTWKVSCLGDSKAI